MFSFASFSFSKEKEVFFCLLILLGEAIAKAKTLMPVFSFAYFSFSKEK